MDELTRVGNITHPVNQMVEYLDMRSVLKKIWLDGFKVGSINIENELKK